MNQAGNNMLERLFLRYPELARCERDIHIVCDEVIACYRSGGKVLICGNGGSAADADHIVGELMKGFLLKRPVTGPAREALRGMYPGDGESLADRLQGALPAIALTAHSAIMTAYANDVSPDMVFAQQVFGYGKNGDILLGISTSGNSLNVVNAVKVARAMGLTTAGLTGCDGGALKPLCDRAICVPAESTPDIQELHLPVYHAICAAVENELFG